jgi:cysteinyl-tRNA synthetase
MDDDFNTPQALAALFDLARDINRASDEGYSIGAEQKLLRELSSVLGLTLKETEKPSLDVKPFVNLRKSTIAEIRKANLDKLIQGMESALSKQDIDVEDVASHINWLANIRAELRKDKQFQLADEIRVKLGELGIALKDTPKGTQWERG